MSHHVYVLPATGHVVVRTGPRGDDARRPTYDPDKLDAIERSAETGSVIRVGEGSYAIVRRRGPSKSHLPTARNDLDIFVPLPNGTLFTDDRFLDRFL